MTIRFQSGGYNPAAENLTAALIAYGAAKGTDLTGLATSAEITAAIDSILAGTPTLEEIETVLEAVLAAYGAAKTTDLADLATTAEVETRATRADVDAALADYDVATVADLAGIGGGGGGALTGEMRMFGGALPSGWTYVNRVGDLTGFTVVCGGIMPVNTSAASTNVAKGIVGNDDLIYVGIGDSVYQYTPSTQVWIQRQSARPTITSGQRSGWLPLAGGKLLACGGSTTSSNRVDEFDPLTNSWTQKANLPITSRGGAGVLLNDGRSLFMGGATGAGVTQTWNYAYDPVANSWSSALAALPLAVYLPYVATCGNGKVIYVTLTGLYYLYDPVADTWSSSAATPFTALANATIGTMPDGKVLFVNGSSSTAMFIYDPTADTWSTISNGVPLATTNKAYPSLFAMADGNMMLAGLGASSGEINRLNFIIPTGDTVITQPYYARKD